MWRLLRVAGGERLGGPLSMKEGVGLLLGLVEQLGCCEAVAEALGAVEGEALPCDCVGELLREAGALPLGCACVAETVAVAGTGVGESPPRDTVAEALEQGVAPCEGTAQWPGVGERLVPQGWEGEGGALWDTVGLPLPSGEAVYVREALPVAESKGVAEREGAREGVAGVVALAGALALPPAASLAEGETLGEREGERVPGEALYDSSAEAVLGA